MFVVRSSFVGCPAPLAASVLALARLFPGLGAVAVRPSVRSFSGWVCVCSFRSSVVARRFASVAAARFFAPGAFVAVRRVGRRFRCSVPCLSPGGLVVARPVSRVAVRVGGRRFRVFGVSPALAGFFAGVSSVGFSGSRSCPRAVAAVRSVLPLVPRRGCRVSVGCASGVDAVVRSCFGGSRSLLVFSASRFAGSVRAALARRSAACVRSVAAGRRGLLVVAPSGSCPVGVVPGRSFRGCGSGSWGSAALAVGRGRRVLLFSPGGVPSWRGGSWVAVPGAPGWWFWVSAPLAVQLSLF